jgi:hypothetical protein
MYVTTVFPFLFVCFMELEILVGTCGRIESFIKNGDEVLGTNFFIFKKVYHFSSNSFST